MPMPDSLPVSSAVRAAVGDLIVRDNSDETRKGHFDVDARQED
jgi:hypothetical protein